MTISELRQLLDRVRDGALDPGAASDRILEMLRAAPFEDLGFARVDHDRAVRQGFPEVILGIGKTPAQIAAIAERIVSRGHALLVTRAPWPIVIAMFVNAGAIAAGAVFGRYHYAADAIFGWIVALIVWAVSGQ